MHPVRRWNCVFEQKPGRLDICRDHAFFDQAMGIIARQHAGLYHLAAGAEHKTHLRRFKLDGTTLLPRLRQRLVQLMQMTQLRHQRTDRRSRIWAVALQHLCHLGVGQAGM